MMLKHFVLMAVMMMGSTAVQAGDSGQACLAYGKQVMKNSPDMMNVLNQVIIKDDDIRESYYDGNIGKQHIATEIIINAHSSQEVFGKMLCLLENDKPLYFTFIPAE